MSRSTRILALVFLAAGALLGYAAAAASFRFALAQDVKQAAQPPTPEPGSPAATTTIDGKQLPPPPPKFGGVIKESAKDSKPWWPPRVVPPKGAPNVLLIMTDDKDNVSTAGLR